MRKLHHLPLHGLPLHVAALGVLLGGCGNRIRGEIEDHQIKPKSVFFFSQPQVLGTDGLIGVVMTDRKNGCEDWGFYLTASQGVTNPADQATNWAAVFASTVKVANRPPIALPGSCLSSSRVPPLDR